MRIDRFLVAVAAAAGFTAVAAGAFGAHGLRERWAATPERLAWWETAARYHLTHALAILGTAVAAGWLRPGLSRVAGLLFAGGVVVFSGSLYLLALTGHRWLGAVTPFGGLALLAGWAVLFVAALRGSAGGGDA